MEVAQQQTGLICRQAAIHLRNRKSKEIACWPVKSRMFGSSDINSPIYTLYCTESAKFSPLRSRISRKNSVVKCQSVSSYVDPGDADERIHKSRNSSTDGIKNGPINNWLRSEGVRSELILLALPAVFGQAIDPFAQMMETAYIGRIGALELASAGVGISIFNIVSKVFNVPLLSITTSFVAEDISKNDAESFVPGETQQRLELPSISTALILALGLGTIEALILSFGSRALLDIMGVTLASPMRSPAQLFLSIRALGAPANVLSLAVQGVFRGFKDTKTPVLYLGLGNLSTVALLPIFVYAFHLGLGGAAIATVASQYITTILLVWSLGKRAVILPPKFEQLKFGAYLKSGGMMMGRTLSVLGTFTIATAMAARQGPSAMAAYQICLQVWLAVSLLADALAVSSQALIASSFAMNDYKKVKETANFALKAGVFAGVILGVGLYAFFGDIAKLFTRDSGVLEIIKSCALFICASQPINALAFVFDGLHYGVSDFFYAARAMMVVGAISSLVLFYAPSRIGLAGVWAGLICLMALRMAAGFVRLQQKSGPWFFLHQKEQI